MHGEHEAQSQLRLAGGYWVLPMQWLVTAAVNNEFLHGAASAFLCFASLALQIFGPRQLVFQA